MAAEDPEVETAAALVLFTAHAHFLEFTDLAGSDELLHGRKHGVITVPMSNRQTHAFFSAELHDLVGFGQGTHEGLLDIDALHAGLDGGDNHVAMLMDVPGTDRRDVGLGLGQHDLVVGISLHATKLLGFDRKPLGIRIGDGDNLRLRDLEPDGVLAMPVIALAGMADDADGQRPLPTLGAQERGRQSQGGEGEEIAAFHVTWRT